jgi:Skp family chaperone for outer membrane proteins
MGVLRAFVIWLVLALPASAQQSSPPILIVDSERLLIETLYGRRIAADLAAQAAELQAENDRIVESLTLEERSLTVRRAEMDIEEFRTESEAFDTKVQEVRRVRDAKNVELQVATAGARGEFERQSRSVLETMMRERGAAMVIERRFVLLWTRGADITDDAIVRIDAELGDGTQ